MSLSANLVFLVTLGAFLASGFALWRSLRELSLVTLRRDLWQLHDELIDGLRADDYLVREDATRLLECVRLTIQHARDLSPLHVFGTDALHRLSGAYKYVNRSSRRTATRVLTGDLRDPALDLMRKRLMATMRRHLVVATPMSWLFVLCVPLAYAVWRVIHGGDHVLQSTADLAERPLRTDLTIEDLVDHLGTGSSRPLASCV